MVLICCPHIASKRESTDFSPVQPFQQTESFLRPTQTLAKIVQTASYERMALCNSLATAAGLCLHVGSCGAMFAIACGGQRKVPDFAEMVEVVRLRVLLQTQAKSGVFFFEPVERMFRPSLSFSPIEGSGDVCFETMDSKLWMLVTAGRT
jgi:hypothetical protein